MRQEQVFQHITNKARLTLSSTPFDMYQQFYYSAMQSLSGTLQPPSPGINSYAIGYDYDGTEVTYDVEVDWAPWITWLSQRVEPFQVTHRSRLVAMAFNQLKVNELDYRIDQVKGMYSKLVSAALTDRESLELLQIVLDETERHMKFNPVWIVQYIKEHISSSLGDGVKWRDALTITLDQWREVFNILKESLEEIRRLLGWYSIIVWYTGQRARSDELVSLLTNYLGYVMTRTRIILFHPAMSLWTLFIPQKASWYTTILSKAAELLGSAGTYHFPYSLGGKVYVKAMELLQSNQLSAHDGKSWESSVAILLGKYFRPFMVYFTDIPMLPSGETFTSLFGTLASMVATRHVNADMIVLGDDINIFHPREVRLPGPFIERQEEDSKYMWMLGVTYRVKLEQPRISGFKVSRDRAKSMIPARLSEFDRQSVLIAKTMDLRSRASWAGLFLGWFGDRTLIDSLQSIEPGEFFAPSEYFDQLVQKPENLARIDPFAWAEREGIKKLITVA